MSHTKITCMIWAFYTDFHLWLSIFSRELDLKVEVKMKEFGPFWHMDGNSHKMSLKKTKKTRLTVYVCCLSSMKLSHFPQLNCLQIKLSVSFQGFLLSVVLQLLELNWFTAHIPRDTAVLLSQCAFPKQQQNWVHLLSVQLKVIIIIRNSQENMSRTTGIVENITERHAGKHKKG